MDKDELSDEYKAGYYDAFVTEAVEDKDRFSDGHTDYAKGYYDGDDALIKYIED